MHTKSVANSQNSDESEKKAEKSGGLAEEPKVESKKRAREDDEADGNIAKKVDSKSEAAAES